MRELNAQAITQAVKQLCIDANCHLPEDMQNRIRACYDNEKWPQARDILEQIMENYTIAGEKNQPICQDTGMACVFLKIGQEVHIVGDLTEAVNEGVRQGYTEGPPAPGKHRGQYPRHALLRDRPRRQGGNYRSPQGLWKRKYESN